jgi:DNA-binding response OmpR family regulator
MIRPHILLVEDEPNIARGIIFNLEEEGYRVTHAETGEDALRHLCDETFAVAVLDLMLPGIGGLEVCRAIRRQDLRLPVLILTARGEEQDRIAGLAAGADDYLTKPFSLDEFLLRIKGMLRRSEWYRPEGAGGRFHFGANAVDLKGKRAVTAHGVIHLTDLEVRMLRLFLTRDNEAISRRELLESVWGVSPDSETRTLDNFIVRLRKYFEPDPTAPIHFLTERGQGYRFVREPGKTVG